MSTIIVTHQLRDAFYVATHQALRSAGGVEFAEAPPAKVAETQFMMLRDGRVAFEGDVNELRASDDPYLRAFLVGLATR